MVKKFKNLHFSGDKWQLAEKNFDKFRKTFEIELGMKLKEGFTILSYNFPIPLLLWDGVNELFENNSNLNSKTQILYMVKKLKNLRFSSAEWQLAEKDFDNFQKTFEIELGIKLKRRVHHFVI